MGWSSSSPPPCPLYAREVTMNMKELFIMRCDQGTLIRVWKQNKFRRYWNPSNASLERVNYMLAFSRKNSVFVNANATGFVAEFG